MAAFVLAALFALGPVALGYLSRNRWRHPMRSYVVSYDDRIVIPAGEGGLYQITASITFADPPVTRHRIEETET